MSCARALSCAISSTDSCARALSRAISSTDSCARALSAGLGCSCCALRAERERAKRVTARLLPDWTPRKQSKREANCSPHRAPASFQEADRAKKAAKKSASKPCQMPTSSLCAALLLDERVQNFSDLDDRVASRLRPPSICIALPTAQSWPPCGNKSSWTPEPAPKPVELAFGHRW